MAGSSQQSGRGPPLTRLLRGPGAIPPASGEVEAAAEARRRPMGASPPPLLPPPSPSPQRQELAPSRPRAHPRSSLRPPLARPGPPRLPTPHPPFPAPAPRPGARLSRPEPPFPPPSAPPQEGGGRDGSAQNPPTPGGGFAASPGGLRGSGSPSPTVTPSASAFPFKKNGAAAAAAADRSAHAPKGQRAGANREPRGGEAGSAIVKGTAATRGRGPGRGGPRGEAGDEGEHAGAGEGGPGRERRARAAAGGWGMRRIPGKAKRERKGLGGRAHPVRPPLAVAYRPLC